MHAVPSTTPQVRIGVDIGGTFTDIVCLVPDGRVFKKKVSSTPEDYALGIMHGIENLFAETGLPGGAVREVIHGTTVASNAILEMAGAKVGLITTKGFRDTLEVGRLRMPRLYDIAWQKPPVLVERYLRREVEERVTAQGRVVKPLAAEEIARALDVLLAEGIEALAVCLVNSYANAEHERFVRSVVQRRAPDLTVCLSSEVLPEVGEYERTSATVINTYVMPVVERYLSTLRVGLHRLGVRSPLLIMQSNGGTMSAENAAKTPMHIIESGPAAGVVGAQALSVHMHLDNVITVDMGGTTAKASLIEGGQVSRSSEYEVGGGIMQGSRLLRGSGYLLRVPAIDLAEVGAGGGSIIWIDGAGSMRIGPRSAGAAPGPACYDLGGNEPTITDANVVLGYLNPQYLAGGAVKLSAAKAHEAVRRAVAEPLGLEPVDAAHGAHRLAASSMTRAIRAVSSERGRDPRQYALMAFGGNGPLFAASLARELGMTRIVIPPAPGLFSSFGLLYSETQHHYARTYLRRTEAVDVTELNTVLQDMARDAARQLADEEFSPEARSVRRYLDLRYRGQSFQLTVPLPEGVLVEESIADLKRAFGREHERTYGHRGAEHDIVEIVTLRVVAQGIPSGPRVPDRLQIADQTGAAESAGRRAYFGRDVGWCDVPVIRRRDLALPRTGPCIVEEYDATCVVPPGARASLDGFGNILLDITRV
jgi:N-methylhydantoinase A